MQLVGPVARVPAEGDPGVRGAAGGGVPQGMGAGGRARRGVRAQGIDGRGAGVPPDGVGAAGGGGGAARAPAGAVDGQQQQRRGGGGLGRAKAAKHLMCAATFLGEARGAILAARI